MAESEGVCICNFDRRHQISLSPAMCKDVSPFTLTWRVIFVDLIGKNIISVRL